MKGECILRMALFSVEACALVTFMSLEKLFSALRMHIQMGFDSNWIATCVEGLLTQFWKEA